MRILFLSRWLPYPADNGSKIRIFNLLQQLGSAHEVDLVTFDERGAEAAAVVAPELSQLCSVVKVVPYRAFRPYSVRSLTGALSPTPRFLIDTYDAGMSGAIRETIRQRRPDVLIASELDMVPYALEIDGIPRMLEELELTGYYDACVHARSHRQRLRSSVTWFKLTRYLRSVLPRFAACTVVSTREADLLDRVAPGYDRIEVLPNAVDFKRYQRDYGPLRPHSMVFSGALTFGPNLDATRFFLNDVFPFIAARVPDAHLCVTGSAPDDARRSLPLQRGVEFTGHLADVRPHIATSGVAVVPVRLGGGTRLKILEAMALGTPVVATAKGAEGLHVRHEHDILLADDPWDFADAVARVLESAEVRSQLSIAGRRLIETTYDWAIVGHRARTLVERLAQSPVLV